MCHASVILFGVIAIHEPDVRSKRVIEIGSFDVNGSMRQYIQSLKPLEYIGIDIVDGPGVDVICNVDYSVEMFGEESFDLIIVNEVLEHVRDWRQAVSNIKRICRRGGKVLITTRSRGFPIHNFPSDYWRYEKEDFSNIFSDLEIEMLESDREDTPGVFLFAKKPNDFNENDNENLSLYSIITGTRKVALNDLDFQNPYYLQSEKRRRFRERIQRFASLFMKIMN